MKDRFFCRRNLVCFEACSECEVHGECFMCTSCGDTGKCSSCTRSYEGADASPAGTGASGEDCRGGAGQGREKPGRGEEVRGPDRRH